MKKLGLKNVPVAKLAKRLQLLERLLYIERSHLEKNTPERAYLLEMLDGSGPKQRAKAIQFLEDAKDTANFLSSLEVRYETLRKEFRERPESGEIPYKMMYQFGGGPRA